MNSRCQPCVEKHAQQDLFLNNHELKGGIFIYDTECAQPSVSGNSVSKSNKPDMYGIRFNDEGKPETICMIEVKSTSSELKGACSIEKHKEGMEEYLTLTRLDKNKTEIPLIEDRKREACRIMNQYNDLKLYGVNEVFSEDELITLDVEIIFVLTNEISLDSSIKKDKTVKDVLCGAGYKSFDLMKCGSYPEHLEAVVKRF